MSSEIVPCMFSSFLADHAYSSGLGGTWAGISVLRQQPPVLGFYCPFVRPLEVQTGISPAGHKPGRRVVGRCRADLIAQAGRLRLESCMVGQAPHDVFRLVRGRDCGRGLATVNKMTYCFSVTVASVALLPAPPDLPRGRALSSERRSSDSTSRTGYETSTFLTAVSE